MIRRPGPASELLAQECERLAEREDLRGEQALADVARQCRQPLRVMIAGDVSAGKSTLVNALLGQRIAESGRAETTAHLTWYRHPDLAGDRSPGDRYRIVDMWFPLADRIILLDSPGLNTTSEAHRSTLSLLSGRDYDTGSASALIYVVVGVLSGEGFRRISEFAALSGGGLGNIALIGGKAETVSEQSVRESAARSETVEETARKTERRLRTRKVPVRSVAVSQQLAMAARCGLVTADHATLVRRILGDSDFRFFAANGWEQLASAWAARGQSNAELAPLRALFPSLSWLTAEVRDITGLDAAALSACCERVSRLRHLERILIEFAADADLLTAYAAMERLQRWASHRGPYRSSVIRERLDALREQPSFAGLQARRAALLLRSSIMDHVPEDQRARALALLRGESGAEPGPSWTDEAGQWQLRANSKGHGVLAAEVADIVAAAMGRLLARSKGGLCSDIC